MVITRDALRGTGTMMRRGLGVGIVPLSEHEQRILAEFEESLVRQDPEFAERVRSESVYRHAGRYCKWAAATFVLGVVVLVAFFAKNRWSASSGSSSCSVRPLSSSAICAGWAGPVGTT